MKQKTKDIIALIILIIQIIGGIFLIIFGIYRVKCENYLSAAIIACGVFLLIGAGREDVAKIFNLFKK
jgi:nitrate reductase gamma subunit